MTALLVIWRTMHYSSFFRIPKPLAARSTRAGATILTRVSGIQDKSQDISLQTFCKHNEEERAPLLKALVLFH